MFTKNIKNNKVIYIYYCWLLATTGYFYYILLVITGYWLCVPVAGYVVAVLIIRDSALNLYIILSHF